jgi:hypothetical protein
LISASRSPSCSTRLYASFCPKPIKVFITYDHMYEQIKSYLSKGFFKILRR